MNYNNFDDILTNKISQIDNYYFVADNYELALLGTHKQILMCSYYGLLGTTQSIYP